jgi:hypothetical protein
VVRGRVRHLFVGDRRVAAVPRSDEGVSTVTPIDFLVAFIGLGFALGLLAALLGD